MRHEAVPASQSSHRRGADPGRERDGFVLEHPEPECQLDGPLFPLGRDGAGPAGSRQVEEPVQTVHRVAMTPPASCLAADAGLCGGGRDGWKRSRQQHHGCAAPDASRLTGDAAKQSLQCNTVLHGQDERKSSGTCRHGDRQGEGGGMSRILRFRPRHLSRIAWD